ncbi:hypothetical protein ASG41_22575 [Modestobacter sp. Leaf380]|nr:hypothetical protein ASG41_22575 [Modestobacter sp. Leaf380]
MARVAGVSRATVSYVLNRAPNQSIPESTRQRVLAAAAQLRYRPSPAARVLRTGRSDVVLGLLPELPHSPVYQEALDEVGVALAEAGMLLVVHTVGPRSLPLSAVWSALTPAAVFALGEIAESDVEEMRSAGIRVAVALSGPAPGRSREGSGDRTIGQAQGDHLLALGHRDVAVAWSPEHGLRLLSDGRLAGLTGALAAAGCPAPVVAEVPGDLAGATAALADLRSTHPRVTAVAAYDDAVGAALLHAARDLGVPVPGTLSVLGAFDHPPGLLTTPALSTVRVDLATRMRGVAAALVSAVGGGPLELPRFDTSTTELLDRGSTAPPPS